MKKIEKYLECLQTPQEESIFPMDSQCCGKKIYRQVYPESTTQKENLLVDFDGTIHTYEKGWYDGTIYGTPFDGAKEALDFLGKTYNIVIFTTRASKEQQGDDLPNQIRMMEEWLEKYNIHYDWITAEKIGAFKQIDDNVICIIRVN